MSVCQIKITLLECRVPFSTLWITKVNESIFFSKESFEYYLFEKKNNKQERGKAHVIKELQVICYAYFKYDIYESLRTSKTST